MTEKLNPIEQAYQEIPEAWYERSRYKNTLLVTTIAYLLVTSVYDNELKPGNINAHLIGAISYVLGTIADRISTGRGLDTSIRVGKLGISGYELIERNPFISKVFF